MVVKDGDVHPMGSQSVKNRLTPLKTNLDTQKGDYFNKQIHLPTIDFRGDPLRSFSRFRKLHENPRSFRGFKSPLGPYVCFGGGFLFKDLGMRNLFF